MPIIFSMNHEDGYFIAQYKGAISDEALLDEWKSYLNRFDSIQGINQLADLSDADLSGLTVSGIQALSDYFNLISRETNFTSMKIAIYAPEALSFGLSRMYEALTDDIGQAIEVFKDRKEAIRWLTQANISASS